MSGSRSSDDWIDQYGRSHQNPFNRLCHTIGIPMIAVSLPLFAAAPFVAGLWPVPVALFVVGWVLQFAGHVAEGKPPECFPRVCARTSGSAAGATEVAGRRRRTDFDQSAGARAGCFFL
jgi:uncharacterized membrane protein YGL010W